MSISSISHPNPLIPQNYNNSPRLSLPMYLKFPFKPYDCQVELISQIHKTLSSPVQLTKDNKEVNGFNALLESPTGTGEGGRVRGREGERVRSKAVNAGVSVPAIRRAVP